MDGIKIKKLFILVMLTIFMSACVVEKERVYDIPNPEKKEKEIKVFEGEGLFVERISKKHIIVNTGGEEIVYTIPPDLIDFFVDIEKDDAFTYSYVRNVYGEYVFKTVSDENQTFVHIEEGDEHGEEKKSKHEDIEDVSDFKVEVPDAYTLTKMDNGDNKIHLNIDYYNYLIIRPLDVSTNIKEHRWYAAGELKKVDSGNFIELKKDERHKDLSDAEFVFYAESDYERHTYIVKDVDGSRIMYHLVSTTDNPKSIEDGFVSIINTLKTTN